jgi:hypothetical protein
MLDLAIVENGVPRSLGANETILVPASEDHEAYKIAAGEVAKWTEPERNAILVYTAGRDTTPIPSDKRSVGLELRYDQPLDAVNWCDVLVDYPLDERKRAMRIEVTNKREAQIALGYVHDFGAAFGGQHRLDTRPDDARRWIHYRNICDDQIAAGQGTIVMPVPMRTSANVDLLVRANQGKAAMVAMAQREGAILKHSWGIKDTIQATADHAALDTIDINAGWPA